MSHLATPVEQSPRSIAILGADALLVALPSTPTQLANACFAGGFDEVFPATWGDELIAAGCLAQLESRTGPAIFCACPLVAEQLRGATELRRFVVPLISPPVAVARYLRSQRPRDALRITYVGDCPGADDDTIDVRLSPHELLSTLSGRGILPATQRPDLGAHVANDRRRFYSLPGGVPAPQWLAAQWPGRALVDVHAGDALAGLASQTLSRGNTLIDFAPQLGCACAGAVGGIDVEHARKAVIALEPPPAQSGILDPAVPIEVSLAPAGEHRDAEVTWGDFLAALPAALAMHPEHASAPAAGQSSRPSPRRALQKKEALPRAYVAARARARRERSAISRPDRAASAGDSKIAAAASGADAYGVRREEISAARPNPWLARRASNEGMTGPRGTPPSRAGLATADRWLLAGLMLASSVLVAVLTSALTVRGMQPVARAAVPEVALRAQPVVVVAAPPVHVDSAQERAEVSGAVAPPPARPTASTRPAPRHVEPHPERHSVSLAEHTRPLLPASTVPAAPIAMPPRDDPAPQTTSAPSIAAPAAASPLANPAVLEELRAIHAEIDARKRHMDSLTSTLDSLNRVHRPD